MTIHLTRRPAIDDDHTLADRLVADVVAAGGSAASLTSEVLVLMLWSAGQRRDLRARAARLAEIIAARSVTPTV